MRGGVNRRVTKNARHSQYGELPVNMAPLSGPPVGGRAEPQGKLVGPS